MGMAWLSWMALLLLPLAGCGQVGGKAPKPLSRPDMGWAPVQAQPLPPGLSGWSADPEGVLWAIPERTPQLVPLRVKRDGVSSAGAALPIEGLHTGEQTESIAALGAGRWIVGTEGRGVRDSDNLLWLRKEGSIARVERRVPVPYALWQRKGEDNRGIEGLCVADDQVLVAVEPIEEKEGVRTGLLARYADGRFQAIRFPLTSKDGKISGIDCKLVADRLVVVAIERHYEVSRLVRLSLPRQASSGSLSANVTLLRDLRSAIDTPPNFEGISWQVDGFWLLSDNHHGRTTGPTHVLWVAPDSQDAAR